MLLRELRVERVLLEMALRVVDADRPEALDRHVLDVELVDRRAIVLAWGDAKINGVLIGD
jgi:hypothetical protein